MHSRYFVTGGLYCTKFLSCLTVILDNIGKSGMKELNTKSLGFGCSVHLEF